MAIPRTVIYHPVGFDVRNLVRSVDGLRGRSLVGSDAAVRELEGRFAKYVGASHAVAFPYARSAVYFALKSRNFAAGSEIIMPPITIKPMVDVVLALGLRPVFVDIERETLCFDVARLEDAITDRTRAILITYLFGIVPDVKTLMSQCRARGLFVIEDFSHNLNAKYEGKKLGTFGDVGVYSCSVTKTLDAYAGGLAVTDDETLLAALRGAQRTLRRAPAKRVRARIVRDLVWNVATRRWVFSLAVFPLLRLLRRASPRLEQRLTGARLGLKPVSELAEDYFEEFTWLQAQAGLAMLDTVEEEDARRIGNVESIREACRQQLERFPRSLAGAENVYWQCMVYARDEEKVRSALARRGIDTGTTNLSLVCGLGIYPEYERRCPNAEYVKRNALYVPVYGRLTRRELERIQEALRDALSADQA